MTEKERKRETRPGEGRPRVFKSVKELEQKIEEYKKYLEKTGKPPTVAGFAYYLGIDRQTLYNYKAKDKYFDAINNFVKYIMMNYEERCLTDSTTGLIFLMKNYGYTDKQEVEQVIVNTDIAMSDEDAEKVLRKYGYGKSNERSEKRTSFGVASESEE